jgi:phosphoribosylformylglycinamidine synthase subunit PurQ / glutaminase
MTPVVLTFPGSNCDRDVLTAVSAAYGKPATLLWHTEHHLPERTSAVFLPGGFSYGDYLRCGAISARSPIIDSVRKAAARGVPVLGICNGFQILCETGLLPGALMRNARLSFICRQQSLRVDANDTPFTRAFTKGQTVRFPVAHHDGNFFADNATLERLEGEGQVVFRYIDNPNGSRNDIAGICNDERNVVGLMPHPDRAADGVHGSTDGARLFSSVIEAMA